MWDLMKINAFKIRVTENGCHEIVLVYSFPPSSRLQKTPVECNNIMGFDTSHVFVVAGGSRVID